MNIDLDSSMNFNDPEALRSFMLVHRFAHDALVKQILLNGKGNIPTFGLTSSSAEEEWIAAMAAGERRGQPPMALQDWLQYHAQLHNAEYAAIFGQGTVAPDLSTVDFSVPQEFYDWMYAHQQMHDYEAATLGVT